jgi:hypothetical protein
MTAQPEDWNAYPDPHYDEDDDCQCPDHAAQRELREDNRNLIEVRRWLRWLGGI